MAVIVSMGSLYFNGQAQAVGVSYNGETISFGDAIPGKELQWVNVNGLLIADRCLCTNISWEQLDNQGLVFGTPIQIDGQFYLCRCLKVGAENDAPNEWDTALDEAGDSNDLWHWEKQYFWGQETQEYRASDRAVRGWVSARNWYYDGATNQRAIVGFRPALEPLIPAPLDYDSIVGMEITPMGPDNKFVSGRLVAFTDYDLILEAPSPLPDTCKWAVPDGKQIIVDRASVNWLRKN